MRTITTITIILIATFCFGQTDKKLKGKPTTLEETFDYLDQLFDDTAKYTFMTFPEDAATLRLHHGFGTWIRNNWGLWGNSKLNQFFVDNGVKHPDDMSSIILTSYHRHLNNKPIDLNGQTKKSREFYDQIVEKGDTVFLPPRDSFTYTPYIELIKFFPIGDTIVVPFGATKTNLFGNHFGYTYRALAIVKEHNNDKLTIEIIKFTIGKGMKSDYKVGDVINDISPHYCSMLPPTTWTQKKE